MNHSEIIKKKIIEIIDEMGLDLAAGEITNETVLLESGLDSIGFAVLISSLEEELGFDPFVELENPTYPSTFIDLVNVYENRKESDA